MRLKRRLFEKKKTIEQLRRELDDVKNFAESIIQSIGSGIIIAEMDDEPGKEFRAGERISPPL
jgi:predicted RNase H-like nuclease (RuvC/YqgF family)